MSAFGDGSLKQEMLEAIERVVEFHDTNPTKTEVIMAIGCILDYKLGGLENVDTARQQGYDRAKNEMREQLRKELKQEILSEMTNIVMAS